MTERLTTLLREHVERQEPPFLLQPEPVLRQGRRRLRRRRVGVVAAALVAGAVAAAPAVVSRGETSSADDATASALAGYRADRMPATLRAAAEAAFSRSGTDFGAGTFGAFDDQGTALPARHWDKASSMSVSYGGGTDHRFELLLMHSGSEAEGDARQACANDLADGYAFTCEVTTTDTGAVVTVRVLAMRPAKDMSGWSAVTRDELRTGRPVSTDPDQGPIDRGQVWFERAVESVHSDTFLTSALERVKAPDLATAEERFSVRLADARDLVTDPTLAIPRPPRGANGCPWMLHPAGIQCGVTDPGARD
jgi:hypothetical protein